MSRALRLAALAVLLVPASRARPACDATIPAAAPTARYQVNGDGTATDLRTGLTWLRCPLGLALDDGGTPGVPADDRCVPAGAAAFTWGQALAAVQAFNAGGGVGGLTGWRLPSRKELLSIVETRCTAPAVNATVFPGTPRGGFFTSTPYASVAGFAWATDFNGGGEVPVLMSTPLPVRLVR